MKRTRALLEPLSSAETHGRLAGGWREGRGAPGAVQGIGVSGAFLKREVSDGLLGNATTAAGEPRIALDPLAPIAASESSSPSSSSSSSTEEESLRPMSNLERLSRGGCFGSGVGTARGIVIGATFPVKLGKRKKKTNEPPPPPQQQQQQQDQEGAEGAAAAAAAAGEDDEEDNGWARVSAYTPRRFRVDLSDGRVRAVSERKLRQMIIAHRAF